jgi:acetyltransferase-like isoleucine patch superfamily enzyme
MSNRSSFIRRIARAETPFFRLLKKVLRAFLTPTLPVLPGWMRSILRVFFELHYIFVNTFRSLAIFFYYNPLFQGRCRQFGHSVKLEGLPYVSGPVEIYLGDYVRIGGNINITSGSQCDHPRLEIRDRAAIGWDTRITASREVIIEEDAIVSYGCNISDTDGHPRDAEQRAAGKGPPVGDIRPVRIGRYAWIGNGSYVMKGVTIGEGAVISANSVVISNIPPYSLAIGNPAEVLFKNYGRPKRPKLDSGVAAVDGQNTSGNPSAGGGQ